MFNHFGDFDHKIRCSDVLILTTNSKFELLDYSQNLMKYLQIPIDDEVLQNGEFMGSRLNISTIVNGFHDMMVENIGENYFPPQ